MAAAAQVMGRAVISLEVGTCFDDLGLLPGKIRKMFEAH